MASIDCLIQAPFHPPPLLPSAAAPLPPSQAIGPEMPRLAIDGVGGEAGKRLAMALRPGGALVVHSLACGQVPQLSPSVLLYQQVSMHGFSLPQWVADNGGEAYLGMLQSISGEDSRGRVGCEEQA